MKTIIYGNNERAISLVDKVVQDLVEFSYLVQSVGNGNCIQDFEMAGVQTVVFVGMCPEQEIRHALEMGMRVFVLLSPVESSLLNDVTIAKTKSLSPDYEKELKNEFKLFFNEKSKVLNKSEKTAC